MSRKVLRLQQMKKELARMNERAERGEEGTRIIDEIREYIQAIDELEFEIMMERSERRGYITAIGH